MSIPSRRTGLAALPSPAAHPTPSPPALGLGQGSVSGSHGVTTLSSRCCNSRGMRTREPFTQRATEPGKCRRLRARPWCQLGAVAGAQSEAVAQAGLALGSQELRAVGCPRLA